MLHFLLLIYSTTNTGIGGISLGDVLKYISQIGLLGFLVIVLYGGYKKWWVFGWQYREAEDRTSKAEAEKNDWRDLALHGTNLAEKTVDLFKRSKE